jgi:hypothetical protein
LFLEVREQLVPFGKHQVLREWTERHFDERSRIDAHVQQVGH